MRDSVEAGSCLFFWRDAGIFLLFPAGNGIKDEKFIKRSINFWSLSASQFAGRHPSKNVRRVCKTIEILKG